MNQLTLRATSRAEDLGLVALADVATAAKGLDGVRLIGGQMVTLHAYRWRLGASMYRESKDADLGVAEMVARDGRIIDRLEALGYVQRRGGEFIRVLEGDATDVLPPEAAIDVLIPARTSRPRESRRVTDRLVTTEVPGLATALRRPGVRVELSMTRRDGDPLTARLLLPDEVSTVVLRAHAWRRRLSETDAEDLWRSLEIAFAAGVGPQEFSRSDEQSAVKIVADGFGGTSSALKALGTRAGRMRALMARVLGLPPE